MGDAPIDDEDGGLDDDDDDDAGAEDANADVEGPDVAFDGGEADAGDR